MDQIKKIIPVYEDIQWDANTESCVLLAELCKIVYSLKDEGYKRDFAKNPLKLTVSTGQECEIILAHKFPQVNIVLVKVTYNDVKSLKPIVKFVNVFSTDILPNYCNQEQASTWMQKKFIDFVFDKALYVEQIKMVIASICGSNTVFVTGHGFGGVIAELVAYIHNLPGVAFCSPGLTPDMIKVIDDPGAAKIALKYFQCIQSKGDAIGIISGCIHIKDPIELCLYDNLVNRSYIERHSIATLWQLLHRLDFYRFTNVNITDLSNQQKMKVNGFGTAPKEGLVNCVYTKDATVNDLVMVDHTMTMHVLDLTKDGKQYFKDINIEIASYAVTKQIEKHVQPIWKAIGAVRPLEWEYEAKLTGLGNDPAKCTQILLQGISEGIVDWKKDGIIYLVDNSHPKYAGYHSVVYTQGYTIPYAMVSVKNRDWSHTLSHEAIEMLINPLVKRYMHQNDKTINVPMTTEEETKWILTLDDETFDKLDGSEEFVKPWKEQNWDLEACDACEGKPYPYVDPDNDEITNLNIALSDFLLPEYFIVGSPGGKPLNFVGGDKPLTRATFPFSDNIPFPLLEGGYAPLHNVETNENTDMSWGKGIVFSKPTHQFG